MSHERKTMCTCSVLSHAGCPGCTPDVRVSQPRRMSGVFPGCPAPCHPDSSRFAHCCRMSGLRPDVRASPCHQMFGPCNLFSTYVCVILSRRMSGHCPDVWPGAATYTKTASFLGTLYIPLYQSGRGLTTSSQIAPRTQVAPSHFSYTKS